MKLYHRTDHGPAVFAEGFKISGGQDTTGRSWFSSSQAEAEATAGDGRHLITVDMPADVAEQHAYHHRLADELSDGATMPMPGLFLIPSEVVNAYMPFMLTHLTDVGAKRAPEGSRAMEQRKKPLPPRRSPPT